MSVIKDAENRSEGGSDNSISALDDAGNGYSESSVDAMNNDAESSHR